MNWALRKINYNILVPNIGKHIYELSEAEAADYFAWYVDVVPQRVAYLAEICAKEYGVSEEKLDCSPESLLIIWKWFRRRAKTESTKLPKETKQSSCLTHRRASQTRQLTLETEYVLRDIGMYLGETIRKNCPNIYWSYYTTPKRDFFVNYPLLKGFIDRSFGSPQEVCFEPIHMARMQALKIIDRTSKDDDLFNLYNLWSQKV